MSCLAENNPTQLLSRHLLLLLLLPQALLFSFSTGGCKGQGFNVSLLLKEGAALHNFILPSKALHIFTSCEHQTKLYSGIIFGLFPILYFFVLGCATNWLVGWKLFKAGAGVGWLTEVIGKVPFGDFSPWILMHFRRQSLHCASKTRAGFETKLWFQALFPKSSRWSHFWQQWQPERRYLGKFWSCW